MPNLPLCHWSRQLFNLRAPSSTDVPVLLPNQPIVFDYNAYPEFILDACKVVLLGLEICQGKVVSLTCIIFARHGSLDMKYSSIFTADEYALRNLVRKCKTFTTSETRRELEPKCITQSFSGIVTGDAPVHSNSPRSLCESKLRPVSLLFLK